MSNPRTQRIRSTLTDDCFCKKLTAEASKSYIEKMEILENNREVTSIYVPGKKLENHICYGLDPLYSKDGHRMYQFLIEYHKLRPSEGIFYGCRGITLGKNEHEKEIEEFKIDWGKVQTELCKILNNTFPQKDFSRRFKMTDNASDKTYWLFWISLVEDEDIEDVGVRAIKIIREVFARHLEGEKLVEGPMPSKNLNTETAFTNDSYAELLKKLEYVDINKRIDAIKTEKAKQCFECFVESAVNQGYLSPISYYEKAWQTKQTNVDFALMMRAVIEYIKGINGTTIRIPWNAFSKVFLNKKGNPFEANILKTQINRKEKNGNRDLQKHKKAKWVEVVKDMIDETLLKK